MSKLFYEEPKLLTRIIIDEIIHTSDGTIQDVFGDPEEGEEYS